MARLRTQTAWGDVFPELSDARARARRRRMGTQAAMVMLALLVAAAVIGVIRLLATAQEWLTGVVGPYLPGLSRTADASQDLLARLLF